MIVDRIEYANQYYEKLPHLAEALNAISAEPDMDNTKHLFPGGFVMRQTGDTKAVDEAAFEVHRDYIDVFILKEGHETVLWNRLENMEEIAPYDPVKDKLALKGHGSALEMQPGMMCILFPDDAHSACRHTAAESPSSYVKYVIKLKI